MGKIKIVHSSQMIGKNKRKLQEYFDPQFNHQITPNQRSLPKYKNIFEKQKGKSSTKFLPKKLSHGKIDLKKQKQNNPPSKNNLSSHKKSKHQRSVNREYDSPSKDQEDIDFIFKGAQKKVKGNSFAEKIIQVVNDLLKVNKLNQAINVLNQTLRSQPNNFDLIYLLGICHIFNSSFELAIHIFESMLKGKPMKNIYLLLSVCYKKTQKYEQTEQILQECIHRFPKYYEAYIYRGKLYLRLKQFKYALQDFDKAISIDPHKQIGYIGKGDCLRLMERYQEAKKMYTDAFNNTNNNVSLLLRRAICSTELKKYDSALQDINKLLQSDCENSEALYFKGLIFNKISKTISTLERSNDAIICYEQAIKFNSNKRAVTRAIYEITKIKIQNRDYYEGLYTLERAQYLDIDEKVIKNFKILINGVTSMMKKNYQEGIKILTQLVEDKGKISNFIKPLLYSARSYGFMAMERYQNAKEDLDCMEAEFSLDLPNLYNKFICEGILACNNSKYQHSLTLFSKASKVLPYRIQPAFYKAVTLICFSAKILPKQLPDKKKQYLQSAMRTVNKIFTIENNPSLFMIKGLLHYALGDLDKALEDFDQNLKQSIKPNPLVFYLIGLIFAQTGRYHQAISEFKRAIDCDQKHQIPQIFLNRAKCMLITGQINSGFIDLQSYMSFRPSSPQIHIWAGHLLFYIGAYQDAAKAYSNINNINKNFQVLSYRSKCYLTCKDVLNTLSNLKYMIEVKQDNRIIFDYGILDCLRQCSDQNMINFDQIRQKMKDIKRTNDNRFGMMFEEFDYQFYKAVMYFYDKKYAQASKNFKRALDIVEAQSKSTAPIHDKLFYQQFKQLTFTNRSFNYYEITYNIAISEIMFGNHLKAFKMLKNLHDAFPEGEIKQEFAKFVAIVQKQVKNPINNGKSTEQVQEADFVPFPIQNRLCSIFPDVILPFKTPVRTRLFFCLPYVQKPDITPKFQEKILQQFNMASIEIKPEAPWIRRSDQGVIFTDQVIKYDIELSQSSSPQKSQQQEEEQDENQNNDLFQNSQNVQEDLSDRHKDQEGKRMTANQLKQFFKLDKNLEERLSKYNKKQ